MSATDRNPINPNPLQSNKFIMNFARAPNVQYFCQSVIVPGISLSEIPITNPFVEIYAPGEKAIYDVLTLTFIVDEQLKSWIEIHDWIRAMTFPKEFEEYNKLPLLARKNLSYTKSQPQYSDAELSILSSANRPTHRFKFYDVFPISLSTFILDSKDSPDTVITADVSFRYNYYDIQKI